MKLSLTLVLSLAFMAILGSCECVPEIAGPKQVTPSEYADVRFVHAMPDQGKMLIESSGYTVTNEFAYGSRSFDYYEIGAGTNNVRLTTENGSTMFNGVVDFAKNLEYTMIMYGRGSIIRSLVMRDTVAGYSPDWAYIRYTHVSGDTPEVKFEVSNKLTANLQNLNYRKKSDFKPIKPGSYNIDVFDAATGELLTVADRQQISAGSLYTLILRGNKTDQTDRPLECLVIESSVAPEQ
jgi:hypothetical protein